MTATAFPRLDIHLTAMERTVLAAIFKSSAGNGHDFGFVEDARGAVPVKSLGGVVGSLSTKGLLAVHEPVNTGLAVWTQTTWPDGVSAEQVEELLARMGAKG